MKVLYYDCFAGISGDMNLAAMIELGVPKAYLIQELSKLKVSGYQLHTVEALKMGISGTQVTVELEKQAHHHAEHSNGHHPHHEHRPYRKIKEIIEKSNLDKKVKKTSIQIFNKVAVAEAKIHAKSVDEVHFHEVGAVDSIVDIVGASICYHYLNPDKVMCSSVELGGGFVNCAHGKFPVPAPATAEIVKDIPVKKGIVPFETTTPTGAAILATLVDEFTDTPELIISKTSYGIGHRDLDIPNTLRVHLAELKLKNHQDESIIVECNIDDMPAEQFDYLMDKLLSEGAKDVFLTPIIMKKSRPGTKLSVLCSKKLESRIHQVLFLESTTIGLRSHIVKKTMLRREIISIETQFGEIDIKIAYTQEGTTKMKPEYDQCKNASIRYNVPLKNVIEEVLIIAKKVVK